MAKAKSAAKAAPAVKDVFYDVLLRPVITEKATALTEQNKVVFRILPSATRAQVKEAVEALFKVNVVRVNTLVVKGKVKAFRGKPGKREDYKKAIVTLEKGQSIDLGGGVA